MKKKQDDAKLLGQLRRRYKKLARQLQDTEVRERLALRQLSEALQIAGQLRVERDQACAVIARASGVKNG